MNQKVFRPRGAWLALRILPALLFFAGCAREPLRIGFIAPMTGASANIGIEGQKGLSFAVSARNAAGGILGRRIEIIARDDGADPERALAALQELAGAGIRVVALHTTSAAGQGAVAWSAGRDLLLLTHTMSDPRYGNLDDNLIHFGGKTDNFGEVIGRFAAARGLRRVFAAADERNLSYGLAMVEGFHAGAPGLELLETRRLGAGWSHAALAEEVEDFGAEALLLVAPGLDAAKTAQALAAGGYDGLLLLSPWSQDQNLLSYAGAFGERVFFPSSFNPDDRGADYLAFKADYRDIFGEDPVMSSAYAYDLAIFLFQGLEAAGGDEPGKLKAAMLKVPEYRGIQYSLVLNEKGDSRSEYRVLTIGKGVFRDASLGGAESAAE